MKFNYVLNCFILKECLHFNSMVTADWYLLFVSFRINHLKQEVNLYIVLKNYVLKS